MQPSSDHAPTSSRNLRRYGPLVVIVVLLLGVGIAVAVGSGGDDDDGDSADAANDQEIGRVGAPEPTGRMPLTYAEAEEAGTLDEDEWGDRCDTATGTLRMPTVYAAPCVPVFDGDNGGATTPGVTGDTIRIVRYVPEQSADITSLIAGIGATDTPEEIAQTARQYVEIFSATSELYGRRIELVDFQATGLGNDVVAARADAIQIASELKPFAVLNGPGLDRGTFAQELTSNGIVCIDCAGALPKEMLDDMAPYVWAGLPTADQYLATLGAWSANLEAAPDADGDNAVYAGSPELRRSPRKVGVIHFDQDPPLFETPADEVPEDVAVIDSYVLDFATMPQKATELVAKFKADNITTINFIGDPIMPIYLMRAATEQEYFPEWLFTGTALTDTNILARQWDPRQMTQAFGISQLAAPTDQDLQDAMRLYRWYFGGVDTLPPAQNQYALSAAAAGFIVRGVHMAGPELTAETFARGQFRVPPAGGGPTTPQISFGNWGFFPDTDYNGIDDSAEIWWDPTVEAEDETGTPGRGVWRRAHGGTRFINEDDVPTPSPFADVDETVTVVGTLPPEDVPQEYPPPPGSPAASE